MKNIKDELQHIIFGHEPAGETSQLKKVQHFLRSNAQTSFATEKQQQFKSKEAAALLICAEQEKLVYTPVILESDFIGEGGTKGLSIQWFACYQN